MYTVEVDVRMVYSVDGVVDMHVQIQLLMMAV